MKLSRAFLITLSSGLLSVGCSNGGDFTSAALSSHLGGEGPDKQQCKVQPSTKVVLENNPKVRIAETSFGEFAVAQLQSLNSKEAVIKKGRRLVISVDEICVSNRRSERQSEPNRVLRAVQVREGSLLPARSHLVTLAQDFSLPEFVETVENDECVGAVGENVVMRTSAEAFAAPNDPRLGEQKHLPNIKASEGYEQFYSPASGINRDVVIAIIDSGVDISHEDLRESLWTNAGEVAGNGRDDDGNGYVDDVNGYNFASRKADPSPEPWRSGGHIHGTHVAGLAAAKSNNRVGIAGVMGERSKIMSLNVFGAVEGAQTADIDSAIRYAADMGAKVINMSLGGEGRAETTGEAIRYAVSKGVVVIAAAGNSNKDINSNWFTPASFGSEIQGMLAIGAIDSGSNARCSFSNYNTTRVEMGAPGCNGLFATVPGNSYQSMQGTSMASPVAAGAAALAFGLVASRTNADPTPAVVEEIMKAGSRVESGLTRWFREGRTVDLVALATEVDKRYPASGGANPPPDCTP